MQEQQPSATAAGVALLRVLHQKVDDEPKILRDDISEKLLDPRAVRWAMDHLDRFQTEAAVDEVFAFLGRFPKGSELVFTFSPDGARSESHRELERLVARVGEPMQSFVSEEALAAKLRRAGFGEILFVSPAEVAARYLGGRTDGLQAPRRTTLARARIQETSSPTSGRGPHSG